MKTLLRIFLGVALTSSGFATGVSFPFGLGDGAGRWDNSTAKSPRSLTGGLTYSVQGGSFTDYRDLFSWSTVPTPLEFQSDVESVFSLWTSVDPTTGFAAPFSFTPSLGTPVTDSDTATGAEIDLVAFDFGAATFNGTASQGFSSNATKVTLTSGVPGIGGAIITGSDVRMNSNTGTAWTRDLFKRVLLHEIGHSLGLDDIDTVSGPSGAFIDDNFDGTNVTTIQNTLTNAWSNLINPLNPEGGIGGTYNNFTIALADFDGGVGSAPNMLMESNGDAATPFAIDPDSFAGRQFLYPAIIPEPTGVLLLAVGLVPVLLRRRR